jgi:hypothetical protein
MRPVQDTKRSQGKINVRTPQRRTVPLPLEIVFRPDVRGTYKPRETELVNSKGEPYNPMKGGFIGEYVQFGFVPDDPSTTHWVLPDVDDPWLLRGEILHKVEDSDERLNGLTSFYGRWGIGRDDLLVPRDKFPKDCDWFKACDLLREEYKEWRSLIRAAMKTKMSAWPKLGAKFPAAKVDRLCEPMALSVEWQDGRPTGVITCTGILRALIATLQIDALIGAEYRFCARRGCTKSFKVRRKDQRYCDEICKHRQVVRDGRERQRKAAEQAKRQEGKRRGK